MGVGGTLEGDVFTAQCNEKNLAQESGDVNNLLTWDLTFYRPNPYLLILLFLFLWAQDRIKPFSPLPVLLPEVYTWERGMKD